MKIVSFNINSIRARPHQIEHLRDTIDPDVIGLQETKVDDPEFPIEVIKKSQLILLRVSLVILTRIKKDLYNQNLHMVKAK